MDKSPFQRALQQSERQKAEAAQKEQEALRLTAAQERQKREGEAWFRNNINQPVSEYYRELQKRKIAPAHIVHVEGEKGIFFRQPDEDEYGWYILNTFTTEPQKRRCWGRPMPGKMIFLTQNRRLMTFCYDFKDSWMYNSCSWDIDFKESSWRRGSQIFTSSVEDSQAKLDNAVVNMADTIAQGRVILPSDIGFVYPISVPLPLPQKSR